MAGATVAAAGAYAAVWSAVPLLNKVALRAGGPGGGEGVLAWATFAIGAALTTAALLARRGGARRLALEARAALARPVVWAMAALTVAGYLVYFWLVRHMDVHRVALLSPLVLVGTLLGSVALLGERVHASRLVGAGVVGVGLVAFFWEDWRALRAARRH